jgi:hypothetical protein
MSGEELATVWDDWKDAVNMSQRQVENSVAPGFARHDRSAAVSDVAMP